MRKILYIIKNKGCIYIIEKVFLKIIDKNKKTWEAVKFFINRDNIKSVKFIKNSGKNFIADKEEILKFYNINNHIKDKVIKEADKVINNEFDFLGLKLQIKDDIQWNKDFKSGYVWKNKYYKFINLNSKGPMDIKIPWELSRFYFLIVLGKAYMITGSEKYYIKFKETILDWINKNPYKKSVNWTCAMDVSIRAINIIVAKEFFQQKIDEKFEIKLNDLIYIHGKFILENLENHKPRSNHYISDLIGLFWIGVYFRNTEFGQKFINFSMKELESEVNIQVNNDGTDYEASTSYHKLVLELLLFTIIYGKKNSIYFSSTFLKKINSMCEFMYDILKPNAIIPLIGDNDDGRLLILSSYYEWERKDPRYLLSIAAILFNENKYMFSDECSNESIALVFGLKKESLQNNNNLSKKYEDGGFYILRNSRIYCLIRCGELSMRSHGGHSHNEQLSIELNIDGEDIFIDPGTYTYTADYEVRNRYRSTLMHNTVQIESEEQNLINPWNIFELKERTYSKCLTFEDGLFKGYHIGYYESFGCKHMRTVKVTDNEIEIYDEFDENYNIKIINFILPKEIKLTYQKNSVCLNNKYNIYFEHEVFSEDIEYSTSYGVQEFGKRLYLKINSCSNRIVVKIDQHNNENNIDRIIMNKK